MSECDYYYVNRELNRLREHCFRATWRYRWYLETYEALAERAGYGLVLIVHPNGVCEREPYPPEVQEVVDYMIGKIEEIENTFTEQMRRLGMA